MGERHKKNSTPCSYGRSCSGYVCTLQQNRIEQQPTRPLQHRQQHTLQQFDNIKSHVLSFCEDIPLDMKELLPSSGQ